MIGNLIHFLIKKFALFRGRFQIDVVQFILNGKLSDFAEGKYSFRQSIANVLQLVLLRMEEGRRKTSSEETFVDGRNRE